MRRLLLLLVSLVAIPAAAQTLSISDVSVREPAAGEVVVLEFLIVLSQVATAPVSFQVSTSSESATAGADYSGISAGLTIAPGENAAAVPLFIRGDGSAEPNETFVVRISNATNATIEKATARVTILDSDPMTFFVNSADAIDDGGCDAVHCSLREAVKAANLRGGVLDRVHFDIPGSGPHIIDHRNLQLEIFDPVLIDGLTQRGAVANTIASGATSSTLQIAVVGDATSNSPFAFVVEPPAGGTIIRGIAFGHFLTAIRLVASVDVAIEGCFIGTDTTGTREVPNDVGILVENAVRTRIGGASMASRNLIAGNVVGLLVRGQETRATNIFQNLFGTTTSGDAIFRNLEDAIRIENVRLFSGESNSISLNVIGGSGESAIDITQGNGVVINGNWIGVARDGVTAIPNDAGGIRLTGSADASITANVIAANHGAGIVITGSQASSGIVISHNAIRDNRELGIDLRTASGIAGPTANDASDADSGPNGLQNFPAITRAVVNGSFTLMTITLDSQPLTDYLIEVFTNEDCDASGFGEGATYLETVPVTTDATGNARVVRNVPGGAVAGRIMTATATEVRGGNTSELSRCFTVTAPEKPLRRRVVR
jgi:CSLREA domain-containing protein